MIDSTRLLDSILDAAIRCCASDIHIEPYPDFFRIRFRIDGLLRTDAQAPDTAQGQALIGRIKVLAQLDISQRRLPQDGKFAFSFGSSLYDIRVASFPCVQGEKIVLRLLARSAATRTLNDLGLPPSLVSHLKKIAQLETGFFLVTGPTGSGKTTTLHALLSAMDTRERNIVTLEDPVEYLLPGITQAQIFPELGFNFQTALRSVLRQDPDVIMVGEIRDKATAQMAIEAAFTGHLILSTLHAADAPGALVRLLEMGIDPFFVSAALAGIIAQRLVPLLCQHCRQVRPASAQERASLHHYDIDLSSVYFSSGCSHCHSTGTAGQRGIFQFLPMSSALRLAINDGYASDEIMSCAADAGMVCLEASIAQAVAAGQIDFRELLMIKQLPE